MTNFNLLNTKQYLLSLTSSKILPELCPGSMYVQVTRVIYVTINKSIEQKYKNRPLLTQTDELKSNNDK